MHEQERREGILFTVNIELTARDLETPARTDKLEDTIDYGRVAEMVRDVVEGPSHYLLESLAGEILDRLGELDGISAATVRVRKPQPITLDVRVEGVEVELIRTFGQ